MDDPNADWREARRLLAARRYEDAWPLFEARRRLSWVDIPKVRAGYPEWLGEDPAGLSIVVCAEQGFGDQIMFARYLPLLQARGAAVVVACHTPKLGRFFQAAGFEVAPLYVDRPLPPADAWTLMGSLPLRLGVAPPPAAHYVRFEGPPPAGIGVMATGNPAYARDAERSLPAAEAAALNGLGRNLDPHASGARDFLETAAVVACLSLVITVDTAVAHLAGALGKPCWVLLGEGQLDWRWNDGVRSDWYPQFELLRQPAPGDWAGLLAQVRARLADAG